MGKTLYEKVYDAHVVSEKPGELPLLYVDRHLIHEVTSPQAFAGLRDAGRKLRRPELMLGTVDHDISTREATLDVCSPMAKTQVTTLMKNCADFGVTLFGLGHANQGIVHIIGPQTGFTLPGTTLVCGDSHTATHGAFGALAFGIGTSEVEHVMATQTIKQQRLKTMRINCRGRLRPGVYAKDLILAIAGKITTAGGTGHAIEFAGEAVRALSMESRMTLCNMAIEVGAKVGMIAPDETTFEYLKGRLYAPKGEAWDEAVARWKTLASDPDAVFSREIDIDAAAIEPQTTWGTNPGQTCAITGSVPTLDSLTTLSSAKAQNARSRTLVSNRAAALRTQRSMSSSSAPARTGVLKTSAKPRACCAAAASHRASPHLPCRAPWPFAKRPSAKGIADVFRAAGFEWRLPGCSMCLAMNDDRAPEGSRVASTSNRNFVGRQGRGSRTHLMSPAAAAASAVLGRIADPRQFLE